MQPIEGHYTVGGFYEAIENDIDDAWENFLNQASCHFNSILMDGPIEEDDDFPF